MKLRFLVTRYLTVVLMLLLSATLVPAGGQTLDEVISGFDQPAEKTGTPPAGEKQRRLPPWLTLRGRIGLSAAVNVAHHAPEKNAPDDRGLSMLRTTMALESDATIGRWKARVSGHAFYDAAYALKDRSAYSQALLDLYEDEFEWDETYLAGRLSDHLDIKTGRQIVVWGKSDNLRVTDILNPLDNRVPGLVDIKYRRLPVAMTKLDYYTGAWNLSAIVLHEVRFDKNPVFNSDFFPGRYPLPPEDIPNLSLDHQQYALAANGIFRGWDLSLYAARIFDPRSHLSRNTDGRLIRSHNRITMAGLTANMAFGNWLLKGESAGFDGLAFGNRPDREFTRLDLMAGVEYTGFSETHLSLEVVNRHLFDFDDRLRAMPDLAEEDTFQTVATLVRDFANDTLSLKILLTAFGGHGEDGRMERIQLDNDLTDDITLTIGLLLYQSADDGLLADIGSNDRVFMEMTWDF